VPPDHFAHAGQRLEGSHDVEVLIPRKFVELKVTWEWRNPQSFMGKSALLYAVFRE
jgi:hypothetical protein